MFENLLNSNHNVLHFVVLSLQVLTCQNHLIKIQPQFKSNLLAGVEKFHGDSTDFTDDYNVL